MHNVIAPIPDNTNDEYEKPPTKPSISIVDMDDMYEKPPPKPSISREMTDDEKDARPPARPSVLMTFEDLKANIASALKVDNQKEIKVHTKPLPHPPSKDNDRQAAFNMKLAEKTSERKSSEGIISADP